MLDVTFFYGCRRYAATIGANRTIDLVFNALRDAAQDAVGMVARLHKRPKTQVFLALLLAEHANLN